MSNPDCLLHLLTARGRLTLAALRDATTQINGRALETNTDRFRTYKLARYLDMLGHCEYFQRPRPSSVVVAPACLVKLPLLDRNAFVLCGMRSGSTVDEIRAAATELKAHVELAASSRKKFQDELLPDRLWFSFQNASDAVRIAERLKIGFTTMPAGWTLACFSAGLEDFETSLQWRARTVRDDSLRFYAPDRGTYLEGTAEQFGPCLAQLAGDPSWSCLIRNDQEAVVEDLDWARYWAHAEGGATPLAFDNSRRVFAVPSHVPLPRILARALCLCSGVPPIESARKQSNGLRAHMFFRDVPREIALKVADKLGSTLVPKNLSAIEELDV